MRTIDLGELRRVAAGLAVAGLLSVSLAGAAGAQDIETAAGGNGGGSNADANGGAVTVGDTNSGGTSGANIAADAINSIQVGGDDIAAAAIAALLGE